MPNVRDVAAEDRIIEEAMKLESLRDDPALVQCAVAILCSRRMHFAIGPAGLSIVALADQATQMLKIAAADAAYREK